MTQLRYPDEDDIVAEWSSTVWQLRTFKAALEGDIYPLRTRDEAMRRVVEIARRERTRGWLQEPDGEWTVAYDGSQYVPAL